MPVLLVLLTFVTLLLIDHFHSRKQVVVQAALQPLKREVPPDWLPAWWADFEFRESFTIIPDTPGHRARVRAWFVSAWTNLLKLAGKVERIALPRRGQWIRPGQKVWTLHRDGRRARHGFAHRRQRGPTLTRQSSATPSWPAAILTATAGTCPCNPPRPSTHFRNLLGGALAAGGARSPSAGCRERCRWLS